MFITSPERRRQRGAAVIVAIFILVALSALGAFMAVFSISEQVGSALDVSGTRALFAARSGMEWALTKVINDAVPPCAGGAGTTNSFAVNGFGVSVTCVTQPTSEPGMNGLYALNVTACQPAIANACPGDLTSANYVERSLFTLVER